jgi:hypothetical protein
MEEEEGEARTITNIDTDASRYAGITADRTLISALGGTTSPPRPLLPPPLPLPLRHLRRHRRRRANRAIDSPRTAAGWRIRGRRTRGAAGACEGATTRRAATRENARGNESASAKGSASERGSMRAGREIGRVTAPRAITTHRQHRRRLPLLLLGAGAEMACAGAGLI